MPDVLPDVLSFHGRVAIVTGAGRGLGRSYALLLASRGAKVVINDVGSTSIGGAVASNLLEADPAEAVAMEIRASGGEAVSVRCDCRDGQQIVDKAVSSFGGVDIVVCNAGIIRPKMFQNYDDENWDLTLSVHLTGSYKVLKAAWPHMKKGGYGRCVLTSSVTGLYGTIGGAAYATAKTGMLGLSNVLNIEGKKHGISVNCIAPSAQTRMTRTAGPGSEKLKPGEEHEDMVEMSPDYVAPMVAWLCHEKCIDRGLLFEAGSGHFTQTRLQRGAGIVIPSLEESTLEAVAAAAEAIKSFGPDGINGAPEYPTVDNNLFTNPNLSSLGKLRAHRRKQALL